MQDWLWKHLPEGIILALVGIAQFFGRREIRRYDNDRRELRAALVKHADRLALLEREQVTKDDFDELRSSMMASFENMVDRFEKKVDKMHGENQRTIRDNQATLQSIHTQVVDIWKYQASSGGN